jgi:hypothetical protein
MISVPVSANDAAGREIKKAVSTPAAGAINDFNFMAIPLLYVILSYGL